MLSPTVDTNLPTRRADSIEFLLGRENYERWRKMPYDPARMGLERMRQLLEAIGSPEQGLPVIHVAGTKGKGSTSAMIAAALSAAGYRTGLFTSPHLERIEQRMTIDGQPCDGRRIRRTWSICSGRPSRPSIAARPQGQSGPTFFEITTAMALLHFQRQKVQAAVLEVGLGGRLDATNVCQPVVSVITSISFDHTQQLGNTLAAIAGEKAGIIKPGVPVVSGVVEPEARDVIRQVCRRRGCRLVERDTDFAFDYHPPRHLEREAASGQVVYRQVAAPARSDGLHHAERDRVRFRPCLARPAPGGQRRHGTGHARRLAAGGLEHSPGGRPAGPGRLVVAGPGASRIAAAGGRAGRRPQRRLDPGPGGNA